MDDLDTRFKSADYRFRFVDRVRSSEIRIFKELKVVSDSLLLKFDIDPEFAPDVLKKEEIYNRKETNTRVFKLRLRNHNVILKMYKIPDVEVVESTGTVYNHEVEIRYLKIFADFIRHHVCPNFVLPIGHTILNHDEVRTLVNRRVTKGKYMIILSECGDTTLNHLIRYKPLSEYAIAGIIFQVVISLCIVQEVFPSFRHNDLHISNILIQNLAMSENQYVQYRLSGAKYYLNVHRCPFRILIWDMFFSSISEGDAKKYNLTQVVPKKQQIFVVPERPDVPTKSCQNQYFDLHKFFDSLEYVFKLIGVSPPSDLCDLINEVVPEQFKCMSKGLTHKDKTDMKIWETKHVTPAAVLRHPYFGRFQSSIRQPNIICRYNAFKKEKT